MYIFAVFFYIVPENESGMKQVLRTNNMMKWIIVGLDIVVLNLLFFLFYFYVLGCDSLIPVEGEERVKELCLIYNLCYLFCVSVRPPILHLRKVRSEEIVRRVFMTVICFALLAEISTGFVDKKLLDFKMNLLFFVLFCICLLFSRLNTRYMVKSFRKMGRNTVSVFFVGSAPNMLELYNEMMGDLSHGYRVKGYFNDTPSSIFPENVPWLGSVADVVPYFEKNNLKGVRQLYCCLTSDRENDIRTIINFCENHVIRFFSVPNVRNYLKRRMNMDLLGEVPILYIREEPLRQMGNRLGKRLFDIVFSSMFLFIFFPFIFLVVATIIKITSPGPVFFRQKRNGLNGKEFYCYKFRSMKVNAQADTMQAVKDDPRKTRFGDFMRRTNIDELPQFINVLLGDMSVVGPRPHMLKHTKVYSELINRYMVRHLIKPGITGWAQVNGCRGETKELYQMEERVRKDIWYVENWTFWLDIRIIWLTIRNMLMRNEKMAY